MEAGLEFGKSLPFAVELGIAGIIDTAKVKDVAPILASSDQCLPGEEGGGVEMVTFGLREGRVVGSYSVVREDEEGAHALSCLGIGQVEASVVLVAHEDVLKQGSRISYHLFGSPPGVTEHHKVVPLSACGVFERSRDDTERVLFEVADDVVASLLGERSEEGGGVLGEIK